MSSALIIPVEHGGKGGNNGTALAYSISAAGAQDLVQAGQAKLYWSAVNSCYYLRANKRNNLAKLVKILAAYCTPIPA